MIFIHRKSSEIYGWFACLMLAIFVSAPCEALSVVTVTPVVSDDEVLHKVSMIVEGVVTGVETSKSSFFSGCFDFVYTFKVGKVLSGNAVPGDQLVVGSARTLGFVSAGDRQLLLLRSVGASTYDNCSVGSMGRKYNRLEIMMPYGFTSGVFKIQTNPGGDTFLTTNCVFKGLLFKEFFRSKGVAVKSERRFDRECVSLEASYSDLYTKVQESLKGDRAQ